MIGNTEDIPVIKQRQPALPCVVAFALGIFLDRQLGAVNYFLSLEAWLCLGFFFLIVFSGVLRAPQSLRPWALPALFALLVSGGGLSHHLHWNVASPDLLARFASEQARPTRLVLRIESEPTFLPNSLPKFASAWQKEDRTRCQASALQLIKQDRSFPVSGKVLLTISGDATHLHPGDYIRVIGSIRNLPPAQNPAGFDFAQYSRQQGILTSVFCISPEAVEKLPDQPWSWTGLITGSQQKLRRLVRNIFDSSLPKKSSGIAQALLLGERHSLEDEVVLSFRRSGLMHLLSISGLHVGLIGLLCLRVGRLFNLSQRSLFLLMLGGMTFCLILAQMRPPVLRAWFIGILFISGWAMQRKVSFLQSLSLCAWLILLVNPSWLFDRGAQLSFLAMLGIYGLHTSFPKLLFQEDDVSHDNPSPISIATNISWLVRFIKRRAWQSLVISLAITILTMPLLANSFSRVTLTGIPATIISIPVLAASLMLLALLGIVGIVSSSLAAWIAIPTSLSLYALNGIAEFFSNNTLLQWATGRPGDWFLLALYFLGAVAFVCLSNHSSRNKAFYLTGWILLVIANLNSGKLNDSFAAWTGSGKLECRVLSVGHGNAVLVKCPNGRTILIDGGSMENGEFAASIIQSNLADLGADRLDAVLISHTDTDHLNAVPFLMEQIPIREILLNPAGLNPNHPGMQAIVTKAFQQNVPLRTVQTGDLIVIDSEVAIRVKQCPNSPLEKTGNDNADSIVVEIEYRGKKLLFPGDLEDEGQEKLMQQQSPGFDLLLAPHHGGKGENTPEFSNWAKPKIVIVSSNDAKMQSRLETIYGQAQKIYYTSHGAIRVEVTAQGNLQSSQWHPLQYWKKAGEPGQ